LRTLKNNALPRDKLKKHVIPAKAGIQVVDLFKFPLTRELIETKFLNVANY